MRRLLFRPLVMLLTFLVGLFVTFLVTLAGDRLERLLYEPSASIPSLCQSEATGHYSFCSLTEMQELEEAAVYSALIERLGDEERAMLVVVQDHTVTGDQSVGDASEDDHLDRIYESLKREFPRADQETLDSFRANNAQRYPLTHPFLLRIKSWLISQQQVERYSYEKPGDWWEVFYRRYPGASGFFMLSKVGFNRELNQALVYRAFACGDTCGHGSYVLLVKEGGIWYVRGQAGYWIS